MAIPRILVVVPILLVGLLLPTAGPSIKKPADGVLGMSHEHYTSEDVTVRRGETLTMQNNSRFAHTVGPGKDGLLANAAGVPITGAHLLQTNEVLTTGKWNTPGTYSLTCSVHPEMTVRVHVTG